MSERPSSASSGEAGAPTATGGEGTPSPSGGLDGLGQFDIPPDIAAQPRGCKKVDFLFVIDNSLSMAAAQTNLTNSFKGFLAVLGQHLETNNFHIMVVDTDSREVEEGGAESADVCEGALGAGRRANGATGEDCQLPESKRFLATEQGELDAAWLDATFRCMATVGTRGDAREQQVGALLAAISSAQNDPGGCNEGFLRRDAILVVTIITNTDDLESEPSEPRQWYDALLSRKDGNDAAAVVLGFLPGRGIDFVSSPFCSLLAAFNRAPGLEEFVESFPHRRVASVCAPDYGPDFEAAVVESIDLACDNFISPIQ